MRFDWRGFRARHGGLFSALIVVKRLRTKVAVILLSACLIEQVYFREAPFDLDAVNEWVVFGLLAIVSGSVLRLAALGSIVKKQGLGTTGAYSLCRHPLYLGSILIALGFCILLRDASTYVVAAIYFLTFYPLTIAWEEIRLDDRYGEEYRTYRARVPLLLPLGRLQWNGWNWSRAMRNGGLALVVAVCTMLAVVETMAEVLR